jgi:hypothetical protein
MMKLIVFLTLAISMFLVACATGDGQEASEGLSGKNSVQAEQIARDGADMAFLSASAPTAAPAATSAPGARFAPQAAGDGRVSSSALEIAQRKVISTASISIEVELVPAAITEVRVIAENLGGFVEHLDSSGGPERQRASMTVRVPQGQFDPALKRIEALGEVQSRNEGAEDVSEQFIDLEARLKSSLREEQSLLSLLGRTATVSEVLAIERELTRVRADVERFQGQLNFLERRVDLATISVSLFPPSEEVTEAPSASLLIRVSDVDAAVAEVKGLVSTFDGALDRVFLSQRDDQKEAVLSLRVFAGEFDRMMDLLEAQGEVKSKEVHEGKTPLGGAPERAKKPDARVDLTVVEAEDDSTDAWVVGIITAIGGVWLVATLGTLGVFGYRAMRRRKH